MGGLLYIQESQQNNHNKPIEKETREQLLTPVQMLKTEAPQGKELLRN